MKYDYDLITIGLGPAGMAVSVMGAEMGLNVCAIERRAIGGECMNIGCIPSKSLLRVAKARHAVTKFPAMRLAEQQMPEVGEVFAKVREYLVHIGDAKTKPMFSKVDLHLRVGDASFVDRHTVEIAGKRVTARNIFIATGTSPAAPPIPGLDTIDYLTNESIFSLDKVPESLLILGGGAIGCEMAQAFSRLGCRATIVHMDPHLIPVGDPEAGELVEAEFKKEGIEVYNARKIARVAMEDGKVALWTDKDEKLVGERLLVAAGRRFDFSALKLENAGVRVGKRGIEVDDQLRTTARNIYAVGDCNGNHLLTHAAMHQGMLALMNAMMPFFMRFHFKKYAVPWTVFTEPQVSSVGMREADLKAKGIKYETIKLRYDDYGAAIAERVDVGFVKILASKLGRVYGASIVGEGSGEMINEWALIVQNKIRLHKVMFLQHSFPTMGFLSKRASEVWMMNRMKSPMLRRMAQLMYRR